MWFWGLKVKICKMMTSHFATLFHSKKCAWSLFQWTKCSPRGRHAVVFLFMHETEEENCSLYRELISAGRLWVTCAASELNPGPYQASLWGTPFDTNLVHRCAMNRAFLRVITLEKRFFNICLSFSTCDVLPAEHSDWRPILEAAGQSSPTQSGKKTEMFFCMCLPGIFRQAIRMCGDYDLWDVFWCICVSVHPAAFRRRAQDPCVTVEPRYLELGHLELPAISNRIGFPLDLPLCFFSHLLSRTPLSRKQEVQSRHLVTRCIESWEMYWRVRGNESKVRLTGLTTANAEGDKLPVFVNFRDQTIIPEIWRQPRYFEPPLSRTISRYPWEFEIAGFYCICLPTQFETRWPWPKFRKWWERDSN